MGLALCSSLVESPFRAFPIVKGCNFALWGTGACCILFVVR
jgi:hypothetical protein